MDSTELGERLMSFVVRIENSTKGLSKSAHGRYISSQLFRSSASSGANDQEACGGESKADFVHKLQIVLKELKETIYWLRLTSKLSFLPEELLTPLLGEAQQLAKIIGKSIITAKKQLK